MSDTIANVAGTNTNTRYYISTPVSRMPQYLSTIACCIPLWTVFSISLFCPPHDCPHRIHSQIVTCFISMPSSWVNSQYSIHQVQHPPMICCLPLYSWLQDDPWIWLLLVLCLSRGQPPPTKFPWELENILNLSSTHVCELTNRAVETQLLSGHQISQLHPPHYFGLHVGAECIPKLVRVSLPTTSLC